MQIQQHRYGKERVRLTALDRSCTPHRLVICSVSISLEGDFAESYTEGDNRKVVATDSMKNTVYVLAREHGVASIEEFATLLVNHFVDNYEMVTSAEVDIEQERWEPIRASGGAVDDALVRSSSEIWFTSTVRDEDGLWLSSGIDKLQVIKTAKSGFSDFFRDRFATLGDTDDRLFATTVRAEWSLINDSESGGRQDLLRREHVRSTLLEAFASHESKSVQQTLHAMGEAVFANLEEVVTIHLALPNQHHLLVGLEPFGLDNDNCIFVGTDEPFGSIEATLER